MRRIDAGTERRLADGFARTVRAPASREVLGHGFFTLLFLLAAGALAVVADADRALDPAVAAAFVVALAIAARIEFSVGSGFTVPTQVVVVPMLLLLPTPLVPLLTALVMMLSVLIGAVRGTNSVARAPLAIPDAWHSFAPAVVLVAFGAQTPDWAHWPVYALALAAQFGLETLIATGRMGLAYRLRPSVVAGGLPLVFRVDLLLAPIGLLAAMAAGDEPPAALLVLPLVMLIAIL